MLDVPEELHAPLKPVVSFMGMTEYHQRLVQHTTALCALSHGLEQRFQANKDAHKAQSDMRPVEGFIKSAWLKKHCSNTPAVCVMFVDCASDTNWRNAEPVIAQQLEHIRAQRRRHVRLAVALIQTSFEGKVDLDDRSQALKRRCDLDSKQIVSFRADDLASGGEKLQRLCLDLSRGYYKDEVKRLKRLREKYDRNIHARWYFRAMFKISILAELGQDRKTALKYWLRAYNSLWAPANRAFDVDQHRACSEVTNFKFCFLLLECGFSSQAKHQFSNHISRADSYHLHEHLLFRMNRWIARQYELFATLLEWVAPPATQPSSSLLPKEIDRIPHSRAQSYDTHHHPGFYYQAAASHVRTRRRVVQNTAALRNLLVDGQVQVPASIEPDSIRMVDVAYNSITGYDRQFLGSGILGPESRDATSKLVDLLLLAELNLEHAEDVLRLLAKASEHFMLAKSRRIHFFLSSVAAKEHILLGQYDDAHTLLWSVLSMYAQEGWVQLRGDCAKLLVDLAQYSKDTNAFLKCSWALLHPEVHLGEPIKMQTAQNLLRLTSGESIGGFDAPSEPTQIVIDRVNPLMECQLNWQSTSLLIESDAKLHVSIRLLSSQPVQVSSIKVNIDPSPGQIELLEGDKTEQLYNEKPFEYTLSIPQPAVGRFISNGVTVFIGQGNSRLELLWKLPDRVRKFHTQLKDGVLKKDLVPVLVQGYKALEQNSPVMDVHQYPPAMSAELWHQGPALVNELYRTDLVLHSKTEEIISGSLSVSCTSFTGKNVIIMKKSNGRLVQVSDIALPVMKVNQVSVISLYIRLLDAGTAKFHCEGTYTNQRNCVKNKDVTFSIECAVSLDCRMHITPGAVTPLPPAEPTVSPMVAAVDSPCELCMSASSCSPHLLAVDQLTLSRAVDVLSPALIEDNGEPRSQNDDEGRKILSPAGWSSVDKFHMGEQISANWRVMPTLAGDGMSWGTIRVKWRRADAAFSPVGHLSDQHSADAESQTPLNQIKLPDSISELRSFDSGIEVFEQSDWMSKVGPGGDIGSHAETTFKVPPVSVYSSPLSASIKAPSEVPLARPFLVCYTIFNMGNSVEDIVVDVPTQSPQYFLVAGYRSATLKIPPKSSAKVNFNLVPKVAGSFIIPQPNLKSSSFGGPFLRIQDHTVFVWQQDIAA